jgi:hypothetical protein
MFKHLPTYPMYLAALTVLVCWLDIFDFFCTFTWSCHMCAVLLDTIHAQRAPLTFVVDFLSVCLCVGVCGARRAQHPRRGRVPQRHRGNQPFPRAPRVRADVRPAVVRPAPPDGQGTQQARPRLQLWARLHRSVPRKEFAPVADPLARNARRGVHCRPQWAVHNRLQCAELLRPDGKQGRFYSLHRRRHEATVYQV